MRVWHGAAVIVGAVTLLGGCATNEDVLAVRRDVATLRNELASVNRANQSARDLTEERLRKVEGDVRGRVESSMKESETSRVALNQRLEELTTETRFVQGKLEEGSSVLRDIQSRLDDVDRQTRQSGQRVEGIDQQVKAMGQRVQALEQARISGTPPTGAPAGATPPPPAMAVAPGQQSGAGSPPPAGIPPQAPGTPSGAQPPALPPAPATPPVQPPAATATPAPPPRPQPALPPEELYKAALSDYTKGEYDLAITGFRSYIKSYPRTSLASNAQYWLAECYFSQKNYAQAIEEFEVVVRDYGDSPKVPSALFKQGEAYLQTGDTKQATTVLCDLIAKHGKTREARLARDKNVRCR
jgi:tol-pal system protein YbgF